MFEQKWLEVFIFNSAAYFISILFKLCLHVVSEPASMPICSAFSFSNSLLVELCKFLCTCLLIISHIVLGILHMCENLLIIAHRKT
jgi:hypothetical protein